MLGLYRICQSKRVPHTLFSNVHFTIFNRHFSHLSLAGKEFPSSEWTIVRIIFWRRWVLFPMKELIQALKLLIDREYPFLSFLQVQTRGIRFWQ